MAVAAKEAPEMEAIINFSPERMKAPFFLRCTALAFDYMLLLAPPILWLLLSELFDEHGTASIAGSAWVIGIVLFIANFLVFPILRGQTLGKKLCGLTIVKMDGADVTIGSILVRNLLGYLLTVLTLGLGFLLAAVNSSGRTLHDLMSGTIVVRGHKTLA